MRVPLMRKEEEEEEEEKEQEVYEEDDDDEDEEEGVKEEKDEEKTPTRKEGEGGRRNDDEDLAAEAGLLAGGAVEWHRNALGNGALTPGVLAPVIRVVYREESLLAWEVVHLQRTLFRRVSPNDEKRGNRKSFSSWHASLPDPLEGKSTDKQAWSRLGHYISSPLAPSGCEFRVARELLGADRFSKSPSHMMASHRPKSGESGMDRIGVAPLPPEECPIDKDEDVSLADFTPPLTTEGMAEGVDATSLLAFEGDLYDGVIIDPTCLPADGDVFLSRLRSSLGLWASQQRKGVWLKLPTENANLVPLAISEGFAYHHAELHYVMLTKWLPPTPSTLPPNASHQVGVGAFVVNDKREVLAVQEKYGFLRGKNVWKLPTGLVSQQEDIWRAAVREVKEETGIDAEFLEIITFRQAHSAAFGKSDLFMICALKPLSFEITKQDSEIEAAQWMPLDEFLGQPFLKNREMFFRMLMLCVAHLDGRYKGVRPITVPVGAEPSSTAIWTHSPFPSSRMALAWLTRASSASALSPGILLKPVGQEELSLWCGSPYAAQEGYMHRSSGWRNLMSRTPQKSLRSFHRLLLQSSSMHGNVHARTQGSTQSPARLPLLSTHITSSMLGPQGSNLVWWVERKLPQSERRLQFQQDFTPTRMSVKGSTVDTYAPAAHSWTRRVLIGEHDPCGCGSTGQQSLLHAIHVHPCSSRSRPRTLKLSPPRPISTATKSRRGDDREQEVILEGGRESMVDDRRRLEMFDEEKRGDDRAGLDAVVEGLFEGEGMNGGMGLTGGELPSRLEPGHDSGASVSRRQQSQGAEGLFEGEGMAEGNLASGELPSRPESGLGSGASISRRRRSQGRPRKMCYYFTQGKCCLLDDEEHLRQFSHELALQQSPGFRPSDIKNVRKQKFDAFLVLDLEGRVEILEFPVILIDPKSLEAVDYFHRFVKPVAMSRERINEYISGKYGRWGLERVWHDTAVPFTQVLQDFEQWALGHGLMSTGTDPQTMCMHNAAFVTCGNWDVKTKIPEQCVTSQIDLPLYFNEWINLKDVYLNFYGRNASGMKAMLNGLKIPLTGTHHVGLDDAQNIARVLVRMLSHGLVARISARRNEDKTVKFMFRRRVK
ncbi:hypothetical protein CBR_g4826 [Chara braunii]|uniref:Nudix hydrolase domain-containing protein n=1 Tax=Chara braunii TaxID=69332 RepID=A0A388KIY7_CHABU|nr:hypothetical protein CBR_g4826 [Chara braunii]|eukprot:GBG69999.1 hypothetical protein CBR_g4826 [Chara braunii]